MRRVKSIFCILLILAICPAFSMPASAALGVDVLQNGDFTDRDENGIPKGWGCSEGEWQTTIRPAEEGVILSRETDGANLSVSQYVFNPVPGAEYEFTARVKSTNVSGSAVSIKLEYWKGDPAAPKHGDFLGDNQGVFLPNTGGEWKTMTQRFAVPAQCTRISLMMRLYGKGTVQYTRARLVQVTEPIVLNLKTDQVFYYDDAVGSGTATLSTTEFYALSYTDKAVDFSLQDADGRELKRETVPFTEAGASFSYPLSLIESMKTAYTVQAVFKDNGNPLYTLMQNVFKYARPANIDANGQIRDENGNPFHPVVAYHCRETDLEEAGKAGINLAQGYWGGVTPEEYLNIAARNGIQVMVSLYPNLKPAAHPDSRAYAINLLETLKDHEALFGWMIMDEPYYNMYQPEKLLEESYRLIREYDEEHPIYILECEEEHFADAAKYGDIFGIDPYIGSGVLQNTVSDMVEKAERAVESKKPVVAILQTFLDDGYFPVAEDVQHMLYQAAFSGAEGVGYYCFEKAYNDSSLTATDLWPGLKNTGKTLFPDLFSAVSDNDIDGLVAELTTGDVWYKLWNRDGIYAGIAINQSSVAQTVFIPGFRDSIRSTLGTGTANCENGQLEISLPVRGALAINLNQRQNALPSVPEIGFDGSFGTGNGDIPDEFAVLGKSWETVLRSDGETSPGGGAYISLSEDAAVSGLAAGLVPGTTYRISMYAKSESDGAASVHTAYMHTENGTVQRLHVYEKENGIVSEQTLRYAANYGGTDGYCSTDGEWEKIVYTCTLPENANALKIVLQNQGEDAPVCYDDLRVEVASNIIPNGDFEGLDTVFAQTAGQWEKIQGENMEIVSAETYGVPTAGQTNSGLAEGRMMRYTPPCQMQAYVPVRRGETYHLSLDYAAMSTSASPYLWVYYTEGGETRFIMELLPWTETEDWYRYETLFTVPGQAGALTEIRIELRELSGRGTVCWDTITLETAGVRYYQNLRRLENPVSVTGEVNVEMDYLPEVGDENVNAVAAVYSTGAGTPELTDVEIIPVPDSTVPLTVKGSIYIAPLSGANRYTLKEFWWKWQ
ncbi:MAG: hypothetical protein E7390_01785 [Ruminococcaceae bacterium]|nr:hypothetical protein [Oscillospiraceae bacterium]